MLYFTTSDEDPVTGVSRDIDLIPKGSEIKVND